MKRFCSHSLLLALVCACFSARAFPPAPQHLIFGIARDQLGTPLMNPQARVVLVTTNGAQLSAPIEPGLAVGVNFAIDVPMDAGVLPGLYKTNALLQGVAYKLYVVINSVTNIPIQMTGASLAVGAPAGQTRVDLTLGTSSAGDGIPDAWKRAFILSLGLQLNISDLKTNLDYAKDGRTLMQEFLLGTYPFDPEDPFKVIMIDPNPAAPVLEFTTMTGRSYTLLGSSDLQTWSPRSFQVIAGDPDGKTRTDYYSPDIRTLRLQVIPTADAPTAHFFKIQMQ